MPKKNAPLVIQAKDFLTREQLDSFILKKVGGDIDKNSETDIKIVGTIEKLKTLQLDENRRVWGIEIECLQS